MRVGAKHRVEEGDTLIVMVRGKKRRYLVLEVASEHELYVRGPDGAGAWMYVGGPAPEGWEPPRRKSEALH